MTEDAARLLFVKGESGVYTVDSALKKPPEDLTDIAPSLAAAVIGSEVTVELLVQK